MHWTPTTIDLCLSLFPGPGSDGAKAASSCTRYSKFTVRSPFLLPLPALRPRSEPARSNFSQSPAHSSSWTAASSISSAFTDCILGSLSSSFAPKAIWLFSRRYSHPHDRATGVCSDQTIVLTGPKRSLSIRSRFAVSIITQPNSPKTGTFNQQLFLFRTDRGRALSLPLADRIVLQMDQTTSAHQKFFGTSDNSVKTQIWIAIAVYMLVAISKSELGTEARSLHIYRL